MSCVMKIFRMGQTDRLLKSFLPVKQRDKKGSFFLPALCTLLNESVILGAAAAIL